MLQGEEEVLGFVFPIGFSGVFFEHVNTSN